MSNKRLMRVASALAGALGPTWKVAEGDGGPSLGWGRRALVTIYEDPYQHGMVRGARGLVVYERSYGGLAWVVDDGQGTIREAEFGAVGKLAPAVWPVLWGAACHPGEVIAELLLEAGQRIDRQMKRTVESVMGEPVQRAGYVLWGYGAEWPTEPIRVEWSPTSPVATMPDGSRWPCVAAGVRRRHIRGHLPPLALARRLASVTIDYVTAALRSSSFTAEFGAASSDGPYYKIPALPEAVINAAATTSTMVDDWQAAVRRELRDETDAKRAARLKRSSKRRAMALHTPGDDLDELGRERNGWSGEPTSERLPVPVHVVGALWVLGFAVRQIAEMTTGEAGAKSSVNRRLGEVRGGADGWVSTTGEALIDRAGLRWAVEPGQGGERPTGRDRGVGETPKGQHKKRPTADAGAAGGTPPKIRVRRRQPPPSPVPTLDELTAALDREGVAYQLGAGDSVLVEMPGAYLVVDEGDIWNDGDRLTLRPGEAVIERLIDEVRRARAVGQRAG